MAPKPCWRHLAASHRSRTQPAQGHRGCDKHILQSLFSPGACGHADRDFLLCAAKSPFRGSLNCESTKHLQAAGSAPAHGRAAGAAKSSGGAGQLAARHLCGKALVPRTKTLNFKQKFQAQRPLMCDKLNANCALLSPICTSGCFASPLAIYKSHHLKSPEWTAVRKQGRLWPARFSGTPMLEGVKRWLRVSSEHEGNVGTTGGGCYSLTVALITQQDTVGRWSNTI